ncbi:MAG: response regulator transcription factor [Alphaproteobacteria bacterium]|nr:response regulator transcription factor [Alphaproteobacteria bacterium]
MKILVVDDHALFRQGLAMLLKELYPDSEILEAATSAAALESAEQNPDIRLVLLDLKLEDGSGFETLEKLSSDLTNAAVTIVSASEDSRNISRSYKAGAKGYIVKSSTSDVLRHALPLILAGETYIPSHAMSLLTGGGSGGNEPTSSHTGVAGAPNLTPRQQEILLLMAQGLQNRDIASSLGMLEGTVKVHVKSILQKLGVNNRTHAVVTGIRLGLVPSDLVLPES